MNNRKAKIMDRMYSSDGGDFYGEDTEGYAYDPDTSFSEDVSSGVSGFATPESSGSAPQVDTSKADNTKTTAQGLQAAGGATGNPYLIAAGLGLQVMGGAKERELKREQQNINNEISRRDKVMQMMGQLGQGFGRLG